MSELARLVALPLVLCIGFAFAMKGGAAFRWLPGPQPALDIDRTILLHQADASRKKSGAEILLIGDSSCLMDINARDLERITGRQVLNLATLSYMSLADHSRLLANYLATNASAKVVVLLMHPESLRLAARTPYFSDFLDAYLSQRDFNQNESNFLRLTGANLFKTRWLTRFLPIPLSGDYGRMYGFNVDLSRYLTENNGSALDPHRHLSATPQGNPEYRLAPALQVASQQFRASLRPGVQVLVGITPSPAGFVLRNHALNCRDMLDTWSSWLGADAKLDGLPFTMEESQFASATHLNSEGVAIYTRLLAESLNARKAP